MLDHSDSSSSAVLVNAESSTSDFELENSISVIDDFIDDELSLISFCGSSGEIDLSPTVKCYKHSRNTNLNRKLDLAVFLSFALVAGLGIGNFIGLTSSCSQQCSDNLHCSNNLFPFTQMVHSGEVHSDFDEDAGAVDSIPPALNNDSNMPVTAVKENNTSIFTNSVIYDMPLLSVEINNDTTEFVAQEAGFPSELMLSNVLPLLPREYDSKTFDLSPLSDSHVKYPKIHFTLKEQMTYSDVLNVLNSDINNVVHNIQNLVFSTINEESIALNDMTCLNSMFHAFSSSIEQKAKELDHLVSMSSFDNPINGKKQFLKMSHIIIKSVDKLLKNNFINSLLKNEKNINYRLQQICDIGHTVIHGLEKKWNTEKQKLVFHQEKKEKHSKYNKYQSNYNKNEKRKYERKGEYKPKQEKSYTKPKKQVVRKKQY